LRSEISELLAWLKLATNSCYSISEISDRGFEISNKFSGDFVDRVTPVPIPNTEVKPVGADGTARETAWESRKSPGLFKKPARAFCSRGLYYFGRLFLSKLTEKFKDKSV
jgi:hypothetical protein